MFLVERAAFSIRQISRVYGVGRRTVSDAIRRGELPAAKLTPKRFVILRRDFEAWLRSHAAFPTDHAIARVEAVLAREEQAGAAS